MEMDMQWAFTVLPKPTEHWLLCSLSTNSAGYQPVITHRYDGSYQTITPPPLNFLPPNFLECPFGANCV